MFTSFGGTALLFMDFNRRKFWVDSKQIFPELCSQWLLLVFICSVLGSRFFDPDVFTRVDETLCNLGWLSLGLQRGLPFVFNLPINYSGIFFLLGNLARIIQFLSHALNMTHDDLCVLELRHIRKSNWNGAWWLLDKSARSLSISYWMCFRWEVVVLSINVGILFSLRDIQCRPQAILLTSLHWFDARQSNTYMVMVLGALKLNFEILVVVIINVSNRFEIFLPPVVHLNAAIVDICIFIVLICIPWSLYGVRYL